MYFDQKEFGKRLQTQRKAREMTQEELALALGLASKQHISRMERGVEDCSIDLLVEISCVLRVSTDYLLMGKEPNREITRNELHSVILQLKNIAGRM